MTQNIFPVVSQQCIHNHYLSPSGTAHSRENQAEAFQLEAKYRLGLQKSPACLPRKINNHQNKSEPSEKEKSWGL